MWRLLKKPKQLKEEEKVSFWKDDFSDCTALKYLPEYSICKCGTSGRCRYAARYSRTVLCSNPKHKSFIPEDAEPFDPHKDLY